MFHLPKFCILTLIHFLISRCVISGPIYFRHKTLSRAQFDAITLSCIMCASQCWFVFAFKEFVERIEVCFRRVETGFSQNLNSFHELTWCFSTKLCDLITAFMLCLLPKKWMQYYSDPEVLTFLCARIIVIYHKFFSKLCSVSCPMNILAYFVNALAAKQLSSICPSVRPSIYISS